MAAACVIFYSVQGGMSRSKLPHHRGASLAVIADGAAVGVCIAVTSPLVENLQYK